MKRQIEPMSTGVVFIVLCLILFPAHTSHASDQPVKICVLAKRGVARCMEKWSPTAKYLTEKIPGRTFVIVPIDSDGVFSFVENGSVDFVLANPSIYVELERLYGINRIATLKNLRRDGTYTKYCGVIFCKADRRDIRYLTDLKGKRFMAVKETSFGGWRMAWREFKEKDIDPYRDFKELRFAGTHDAVVYAVQEGKVDAGTVRTDTLETMEMEHQIDTKYFQVIRDHGKEIVDLPFLYSTRSYPEWPFAKIKHTPDELAEKVATALLEMPRDCAAAKAARCAGWTIPLNYQSVHVCLKELRVGPYKDLGKITPINIFRQYWKWVAAVAFIFLLLSAAVVFYIRFSWKIKDSQEKLKQEIIGHKETEKALRMSEDQKKAILDASIDRIRLVDKDMKIIWANKTAIRALNITPENIEGQFCYKAFVGSDGVCPGCATTKALNSGKIEHAVIRQKDSRTTKGEAFWDTHAIPVKSQSGDIKQIIQVTRNITEQKNADEERNRLATAIEQAAESVVVTDKAGTIQYVNPAFEAISGYTRNEVIGQHTRILKSDKHSKEFYAAMWNTINSGRVWRSHLINKRKDGTLYEEEATISPVKNALGEIINFVAVKRDVTEEISMEKKLRQAQKMEAIGTLAGGIAHDFNNILSAIMGYTELAEYDLPKESKARDHLRQALKAGNRARDLVKQILAFSRQSDRERKPLHVSPIVKEGLKLIRASLPATIEIRQNIGSDLSVIMADPIEIHQIIMNLCTNAANAMDNGGGSLDVSLTNETVDTAFTAKQSSVNPGPYVRLSVKDTGHGMSDDILERIFDPYFTTMEKGDGTGLGLAVVHGIVKSYGGAITVYSEAGKGSTFNIYFPVIEQAVLQDEGKKEVVYTGHQRILFVDDELPLVDLGKKMLEHLGHEVTVRTSSREALEAFRNNPDRFDLVITDKTMPQMTGFDLARELKQIRSDIPIILCTGFSDLSDMDKIKTFGINGLVSKPIVMSEMAENLKKALDKE